MDKVQVREEDGEDRKEGEGKYNEEEDEEEKKKKNKNKYKKEQNNKIITTKTTTMENSQTVCDLQMNKLCLITRCHITSEASQTQELPLVLTIVSSVFLKDHGVTVLL